MKRYISFTVFILLMSAPFAFADKPESIQYIFPLLESTLNSRSTPIIIRPGSVIDEYSLSLSEWLLVEGSHSGFHSGKLILATDHKTLNFKADQFFNPDETITVTLTPGLKTKTGEMVPSFSFHFQITPLPEPLNPYEYIKELNPAYLVSNMNLNTVNKTATDSLPGDFPGFTIEIKGETGAGDIFLSPTHYISGDGYNVIVRNSGDIDYYHKITTGVPVDFKLLPNGLLSYGVMSEFFSFGGGGETEFFLMDSEFQVVDSFQMGNGYVADFHEFQLLPNGHALLLTYDLQPVDLSDIVVGGHPGALIAGSVVQELDGEKNVIFQWRSWDHYDISDSYADLTQTIFDAIHINAIEFDQDKNFLFSTLGLAEVTKVNRQTGDIVWRMGGKKNEFTFINESEEFAPLYFMFQHDVRRLPNGNITIFDGGDTQMRPYSRVVEYQLDEQNKTATRVWEYHHAPDIFTPTMGNAQRLPNGNTIIGWGLASMNGLPAATEVDADGDVVFELKFKKLLFASYRAFRFEWDGGQPAADVLLYELNIGNTYIFDDGDERTGVSMRFDSKEGFGYNEVVVKRYNYAPVNPQFFGKTPVIIPQRITVDQFNIYNINVEISFDENLFQFEHPDSVIVYHREFEGHGLFVPLPTVYNHVTKKVEATMTKFGEFIFAYADWKSPAFPPLLIAPADSHAVDQTHSVTLQWTPVGYVNEYHLQVATDWEFTNPIVDEPYLTKALYELNSVSEQTDYFWRVKSLNDAGESEWSSTCVFTATAPYVTVIIPNGDEKWQRGLGHFIEWNDIIASDVIIELYKNDAYFLTIDTTYSSGGYKWDIPPNLDTCSSYKILIRDMENESTYDISDQNFAIVDEYIGIDESDYQPYAYILYQNYPNPFNAATKIVYELPQSGQVILRIFDILGNEIETLVNEHQSAGRYDIKLSATEMTSGIYFYRLHLGDQFSETKKIVIIK